jgi:hypothetical protein
MMGTARTITWGDVEKYQRLRQGGRELMSRITKTIPRAAREEIAAALGIMRKGVVIFDTEEVAIVLADCCLHDWIRDGRNLITKYSEDHPAAPGTDEEFLLSAYEQARFRVLLPKSVAPGAGMECTDALSGDRLFLMDIALSKGAKDSGPVMATRTVPLDGYWMTTGAGLPITGEKIGKEVVGEVRSLLKAVPPVEPHELALAILRKCLDCGAAEYITYGEHQGSEDAEEPETEFDARPQPATSRRVAGRNDPCPCGSGRKYKRCCLRK